MLRPFAIALGLALALVPAAAAPAAETVLFALQSGDDEREDAGGACLQEDAFLAGVATAGANLKVGGESWGCDSEWAASLEFDLAAFPAGLQVFSATLVVRKTGYSDDSQGFAYLGAFAYAATGAAVLVPRDDLSPETALDIVYPTAANGDLFFDVTAAVQDGLGDGALRAGLLLAGVYSEVRYEDWISIGGRDSPYPPRLVIVHEEAVPGDRISWSVLKVRYR